MSKTCDFPRLRIDTKPSNKVITGTTFIILKKSVSKTRYRIIQQKSATEHYFGEFTQAVHASTCQHCLYNQIGLVVVIQQ